MSDDLGAVIRAIAAEESAAAATDFPFSPDVLSQYVGGVRRRRAGRAAVFAVVALPILGGAAFGIGNLIQSVSVEPGVTPSVSLSPTGDPTLTPSPSTSPSATPSSTASPTPVVTEPAPPPPDPPAPAVPGRVTAVSASPSGSPGSIQVEWDMLVDATGYRVYRSASSGGPFTRAASVLFDATNGHTTTTIEIGVPYERISIAMYSSGSLTYYEVVDGQPACFQVAAFNSAGEGRGSGVVCSNPTVLEPIPDTSTSSS